MVKPHSTIILTGYYLLRFHGSCWTPPWPFLTPHRLRFRTRRDAGVLRPAKSSLLAKWGCRGGYRWSTHLCRGGVCTRLLSGFLAGCRRSVDHVGAGFVDLLVGGQQVFPLLSLNWKHKNNHIRPIRVIVFVVDVFYVLLYSTRLAVWFFFVVDKRRRKNSPSNFCWMTFDLWPFWRKNVDDENSHSNGPIINPFTATCNIVLNLFYQTIISPLSGMKYM